MQKVVASFGLLYSYTSVQLTLIIDFTNFSIERVENTGGECKVEIKGVKSAGGDCSKYKRQ